MKRTAIVTSLTALSTLAACGLYGQMVDNSSLPEPVRVPAGQMQSMFTSAVGELTYECREKKDMAGAYEWAFVGPMATLRNRAGEKVGTYYAGPTWESLDGSKVTGKQQAVAPGMAGAIPLQLVKANPATGQGAMVGTSYIQRLNTKGGVAPTLACGMGEKGQRQTVAYSADYVFYKPAM